LPGRAVASERGHVRGPGLRARAPTSTGGVDAGMRLVETALAGLLDLSASQNTATKTTGGDTIDRSSATEQSNVMGDDGRIRGSGSLRNVHQYRDSPVVPIVAYSIAAGTALSRVIDNIHWASDVLVGSATGYAVGRAVVGLHPGHDTFALYPIVGKDVYGLQFGISF